MAERIRGEDADEDVDAFLKESRDSLHGKYWGPDSLVPVRLVDMRDEPPPAPVRKRARIRPLDIVAGAVGLGAIVMIGLSLRDEKQPAAPAAVAAPAVHVRTAAPPTVVTARIAVAREIAAARVDPPAVVEEPPPPIVETQPAVVETLISEDPASNMAASVSSAPAASAEGATATPPAAPKKRRPKPAATHTPPTASFPD